MAMTKIRHGFWRRLLVSLLLTLVLLAAGVVPSSARQPAPEDAVKAAMLYNFVQFVRWPADAEPVADHEFVLGILGQDSLQEWLLDLAAQSSRSGRMRTVQLDSLQELQAQKHKVQVLYIGRSVHKDLDDILAALAG
ncbi:MAG: YfiR family protein, partial [Syntrophotaleaceae bacterium]